MSDGTRILKILLNILIPVTVMLLVCLLGPKILRFFMPFVIGWVIAMIANPLVRFLEKKLKLVRKHSSVLIVVLVLAAVTGLLYLAFSRIFAEIMGLIADLPGIFERSREELQHAVSGLARFLVVLPLPVQEWFARLNENLGSAIGELFQQIAFPTVTVAGNVAKRIPTVFVYSVVTLLSSYFFIVERDEILTALHRVIPKGVWDYLQFFRKDMQRLIGGYFLAQFRIMFVVAVILALGFLILGVDYGVLLAVLIALLDFLPIFGTGTALFPWAAVKLLSGEWTYALGLVALYLLTQLVRQVVQPKIVGDTMGVPPLATLFLLYLGFKAGGISGMILAVPVGLVGINLYKYGAFDSLLRNVRLLADEVDRFRKDL